MKSLVLVSGPRDAGSGERYEMMARADAVFHEFGIADPLRVDVPPRGTGDDDGGLRAGLDAMVPALQSGSLFGDRTGVLVVDAHHLLKHEAELVAELVVHVDDSVVVVFLATASIPAPLGALLRDRGEVMTVKRLRERDASSWVADAARRRHLHLDAEAAGALVQRFGTDLASMAQALDQLAGGNGDRVTADDVQARFRNRPDEPMWHYADAIAAGDTATALRRLSDFLVHGHPLQLLAFIEGQVRRLALAGAAPNIATYAEWVGSSADSFPVKKAWRRRSEVRDGDVARAIDALSRADLVLKTEPEPVHRVTLERLTVALCRWLGGR